MLNFLPPVITVVTDVELDMTAHPVAIIPLSVLAASWETSERGELYCKSLLG